MEETKGNHTDSTTEINFDPSVNPSTEKLFTKDDDLAFQNRPRLLSESESILTLKTTSASNVKKGLKNLWRRRYRKSRNIKTREIFPNNNESSNSTMNKKYKDNYVTTTKYNVFTFLPKNLLEQFHRFANIYFLSIILLNYCPRIGAFGKEIAMVPVLFVLGVTMIKDIFEDRRRKRSDDKVNNSLCHVWKSQEQKYVEIKWKHVKVGDLVQLRDNDVIPADIVILSTSDPNGLCYVETMNIDGESNLKQRQVVHTDQRKFDPAEFSSKLEIAPPSKKINYFSGNLIHSDIDIVPLTKENLLLRGCVLKNTDFIHGIVAYAGHETKAMLNNSGPRYKLTALESMINQEVIWSVILLVFLCLSGAAGSTIWLSSYEVPYGDSEDGFGLLENDPSFPHFIIISMTYIIILQVLIPLSLYVTIELTKLAQIFHIQSDMELYDEECDKRVQCRALNITEDLGQIQYIFSDKTGTLTENKMVFRRCTINGIDYNHVQDEVPTQIHGHEKINLNSNLVAQIQLHCQKNNYISQNPFLDFFMAMSLCNTVVVSRNRRDRLKSKGSIESISTIELEDSPLFEAESPDELALVEAAHTYNFELIERVPGHVTVSLQGNNLLKFEILHVFPFDSHRKRMSIIVVHPITRQIILFCKGADSVILERLKYKDSEVAEETKKQIDKYAREGLRTLALAKKHISESSYQEWYSFFHEAELDFDNRDQLMANCYDIMEKNLELVGATGIEDRLQDKVPETIEHLRQAGIIVWVLTGDKIETAVNIAYSCKLFTGDMIQHELFAKSRKEMKGRLDRLIETVERDSAIPWALVIDGDTLDFIMGYKNSEEEFLQLTTKSSAVLCCRLTPSQKATVVAAVKEKLNMKTLSIGDGANDVSMIQEADVGIGISGKEGMQAVMASDFAISKFKYLERLLLVHGHWCYDRLARMVLYFFYKNAAFVFVIFWYQTFNGWSAAVMIEDMYLMVFNFLFTSLPPMAIGIYDKDTQPDVLSNNPSLYALGRLRKVHTFHSFWLNMLDALYQSIAIFFTMYFVYNGSNEGITEFGTTVCAACVFTMLLHMAIETKSWTIIHVMSIVFSILAFYVFAFVYDSISIYLGYGNAYWVIHNIIGSPIHWLVILVTPVLALIPRFCVCIIYNSLYPSDVLKANIHRREASRTLWKDHYNAQQHKMQPCVPLSHKRTESMKQYVN